MRVPAGESVLIVVLAAFCRQGELSPERLALVEKAFARLDRDGSGKVTIDDLRGVYNAKKHPEVIEGAGCVAVMREFAVRIGAVEQRGAVCSGNRPCSCV